MAEKLYCYIDMGGIKHYYTTLQGIKRGIRDINERLGIVPYIYKVDVGKIENKIKNINGTYIGHLENEGEILRATGLDKKQFKILKLKGVL